MFINCILLLLYRPHCSKLIIKIIKMCYVEQRFRTASFTDRIPLPIKKYDNNEDHDSSTDDDSETWRSSQSAYSSAVSSDLPHYMLSITFTYRNIFVMVSTSFLFLFQFRRLYIFVFLVTYAR